MSWLHHHRSSVIDVAADKNLGCVLMSTEAYVGMARSYLFGGTFDAVTNVFVHNRIAAVVRKLRYCALFINCHELFHDAVADYLFCLTTKFSFPRLRLLIKIHKSPVSFRALASCTSWILSPAACLLSRELQPLITRFIPSIIRSSGEILRDLRDQHVQKDSMMYTVDIEQLYPSIPHDTAVALVKPECCHYFQTQRSSNWRLKVEITVAFSN